MSAYAALAAAIRAEILADPELAAELGPDRVHDRPPGNPVFPFVSFGPSRSETDDASLHHGAVHFLTLTVWSQKAGRLEADRIADLVRTRLHGAPLALNGHRLVFLEVDAAERDIVPEIRGARVTLSLRAMTETAD